MEPNDAPSTVASSSAATAAVSSAPLKSEETDASTSKSNIHGQLRTSLPLDPHDIDKEYTLIKRRRIEEQIDSETRQLFQTLEWKKSELLKAAKSEHKKIKSSILQSSAAHSAGNCSLCNTSMNKIAAAQCIGKDCSGAVCKSCLKHKIGE